MTFKGPLWPKAFYNSVIFLLDTRAEMCEKAMTKADKWEKDLSNWFQWKVGVFRLFFSAFWQKFSHKGKTVPLTAKQLEGEKWGSSFKSSSWNGGKYTPGQSYPWPVFAVGRLASARGTCHWPWGQFLGKTLLLPEPSLFLKWGVFSSTYLSAQVTQSQFVLACDLLITKRLMTQIQR